MNETEAFAFVEMDPRVERAQVGLVVLGRGRSGREEGWLPTRLLFGGFVGAAAIIMVEPDAVVKVTHDGRDGMFADEADRLVGACPVANQIAEAMDRIRPL